MVELGSCQRRCMFRCRSCISEAESGRRYIWRQDILLFNGYQIVANAIAWILVAPILDIVIYAEPVNLVFTQGITATLLNAISAGVIGTLLLFAYSKTRAKKGSLTKE